MYHKLHCYLKRGKLQSVNGPSSGLDACLCFSLSIQSVLTFTDASEEDLGLYTVEKSDEPELSASYDFTSEGKLDCAK